MKKITPKHAYNHKGILTPLSLANKQDKYFYDSARKEPLVFCKGDIVIPYFRSEADRTWQDIKANIGTNSESFEHYEAKMQFCSSKTIIIGDTAIVGHTAQVEYRIKEINKIVDVAFFDESGDLLIAIEVLHTNPKNHKDIIKFNQINIPIYENDINKGTNTLISYGDNEREDEEKNRLLTEEITRDQERIKSNEDRIERGGDFVFETRQKIKMAGKVYYRETEEIEFFKGTDQEYRESEAFARAESEIDEIKRRISLAKQTISRLTY